jgi:hypothetical protein
MPLPVEFMIIGAQKAGTTALSQFLGQHPRLAMAEGKEAHIFDAGNEVLRLPPAAVNALYTPLFKAAKTGALWGEATPIYLYWPPIIPALNSYNPHLKIIVILRDPVGRAVSQYQMERARGNESLPMWLAFWLEPLRLCWARGELNKPHRCHSYVARGLYASQLAHLRAHFPDGQILVLENNELRQQHQKTLNKVYAFLNINPLEVIAEPVFEGEYSRQETCSLRWLVKPFLKWRFRKSNRELNTILQSMNVEADWPWLKGE